MKDLIIPLIAAGWFFVGGWFLLCSVKDLRKVIKAKSWLKVKGVVIESLLTSFQGDEGATLYLTKIKYLYNDGKSEKEGSTVYFGYDASNIKSHHLKLLDRFETGKEVDVYFDPSNSVQSVLIRSLRPYLVIKILISLFFFIPGLFLGVGYLIYKFC